MARFWLVVFLALLSCDLSDPIILPLKKTDGSLDTEHLLGHVTLLEQTVTSFQQMAVSQNADIAVLKSEISTLKTNQQTMSSQNVEISALKAEVSTLKANQQTLSSQNVDIAALKTEISILKANQQTMASQNAEIPALKTEILILKVNQQKLDTKIFDLQKIHIQSGQPTTGSTSLQNVVNALNTEVRSVSNEVVSLTAKFINLTQDYQTLSSDVNATGAERNAELKGLEQKYQSLSSEVNVTESTMHAGLKNLKYDFQSLSSKVDSTDVKVERGLNLMQQQYLALSSQLNTTCANLTDQNITGTVHDIKTTLGRVLIDVHSAQNDRVLLHNFVTSLEKTVSELNTRSNTTVAELSTITSKIAQLNAEVGFESWMRSLTTVSSGDILKFSNIQDNTGGGYNASTGMFTAPVSGTYLFWTQVRKYTGSALELLMYKAGVRIGEFYTSTGGYVTGSVITAAHVRAGEQVHVNIYNAQSIECCYYSQFGGTLLYRH